MRSLGHKYAAPKRIDLAGVGARRPRKAERHIVAGGRHWQ